TTIGQLADSHFLEEDVLVPLAGMLGFTLDDGGHGFDRLRAAARATPPLARGERERLVERIAAAVPSREGRRRGRGALLARIAELLEVAPDEAHTSSLRSMEDVAA